MSFNKLVRDVHRWVSVAFTLAVIASFIAVTRPEPPAWVNFLALPPLALLLLTGLYLFVLPYIAKGRSARS